MSQISPFQLKEKRKQAKKDGLNVIEEDEDVEKVDTSLFFFYLNSVLYRKSLV